MDKKIKLNIIKYTSKLHRKSQMYVNEQVKNLDITGGQVPFIKILCENGEIIQNEFCRFLDMDKSTVAKMMVKLESEGYIIKTNNKTDNRSTYIKPTKKSYEIYPKLKRIEQNWFNEITNDFSDIEKLIFFDLIKKATYNAGYFFDRCDN